MSNKIKVILLFLCCLLYAQTARAQESKRDADAMLVVDMSGTMTHNDPEGKRYIGADQFLAMFGFNSKNRAGVIFFGDNSKVIVPFGYLSRDMAGRYEGTFKSKEKEVSADYTEIGQALDLARANMGAQDGRLKNIILISDGIVERRPTGSTTKEQADAAAKKELWERFLPEITAAGIVVYTIGLFQDNRGEETLQTIAARTGGGYWHVTDGSKFGEIYETVLMNIGQTTSRVDLSRDNNKISITSFDEGMVIVGRAGLSVTAPNGIVYPREGKTAVEQQYVPYSDGSGILFLGKPQDATQAKDYWTGPWTVNNNGPGRALVYSKVRITADPDTARRTQYFLNEIAPIRLKLFFDNDVAADAQTFLNKLKAEYRVVCLDSDSGWTQKGSLQGNNNIFDGEVLLNHPGNHLVQIELVYEDSSQGVVATRPIQESFQVSNESLFELQIKPDLPTDASRTRGDTFHIEAKQNPNAWANQPEFRGFIGESLKIDLVYDDKKRTSLGVFKADQNGSFKTGDLTFSDSGEPVVEALFTGELNHQALGDRRLLHPKVKTLMTSGPFKVKDTWWPPPSWFLVTLPSTLAAFLALFVFVRHKQWQRLTQKSISSNQGQRANVTADENRLWSSAFRKPRRTIGGPESTADIKLDVGDDEILAEIGEDLTFRFFIIRRSDTEIYLNSTTRPLEQNKKIYVEPTDEIIIHGVPHRFEDFRV